MITLSFSLLEIHAQGEVPQEEEYEIGDIEEIKEEKSSGKATCILCLEEKANWAATPCGHVCYCQECKPATNVKKCPLCRKSVTDWLRIYF